MTASDLIRSYRLKRAAQMLREGQSITSAAYATGFENLAYFSTRFKDQYAMTPTEYIKTAS
jgi:AraC-like DNA-binding protein